MPATPQRTTRQRKQNHRGPARREQPGLFPLAPPSHRMPGCDRPYQIEAVEAMVKGLAVGGRGQLRAACGTGKTLMALRVAERLLSPTGIVVILVPTVGLVAQTLKVWSEHHAGHTPLAVCSDSSVAPGSGSATKSEDDTFGDTTDIVDPVTTDPEVVSAWLARPGGDGVRLIVGTHVSCHVVGEGLQRANQGADLLIVDEAHRTAGPTDKRVALVHDDDVLPALRRLYMTATPRISRQRDAAVYSMDDVEVYGPVLYNYPFSRAIADNWLDDYRVAVIGVTQAEVLAVLRRLEVRSRRRVTTPSAVDIADQRTAMVQAAIARAANELGLRRVIAFCPRIADADQFAQTFPDTLSVLSRSARPARQLTAMAVNGTMNQAARAFVLDTLAKPPGEGWAVVSNARCLSEGVDVPAVDAIAFTAPKKSETDIVQAVGRALRRAPGGSGVATIIIPILLPDSQPVNGDSLDDFDAGAFDVLWEVVAALRAHDDAFSTALDYHRGTGFRGQSDVLEHIDFDFPASYSSASFLDSLTIRLVKNATSNWWDGYAALREFVADNGHARVKRRHVTRDGLKLGLWVVNARRAWVSGRLGAERIEALNKLGFIFDVHADRWESNLATLTAFHARHGHTNVPDDLISGYGTSLKLALGVYRKAYAEQTLAPERVRALEALGFDWTPHSERAWQCMIDALREYRDKHGHILVPGDYKNARGHSVSAWLTTQRKRRKDDEISDDEISQLDDLGMIWDTEDLAWSRKLVTLRDYHARHGTINVTTSSSGDPEESSIYRTVVDIRRRYVKRTLTSKQVADVEALGIEWERPSPPRSWRGHYYEAVAYKRKHDDLDIPLGFTTASGCALGRWLQRQRNLRLAGRLSADRIGLLDELGIAWRSDTKNHISWDQAIEMLRVYRRDVGPIEEVPHSYRTTSGFRVRQWVSDQRKRFRRGKLNADEVRQLTELGVCLTSAQTNDVWERDLRALQDYAAQHADPRVTLGRPRDVKRALANVRKALRQNRLDADKAAALDALGIEWRPRRSSVDQFLEVARRYHERHGHLPIDNDVVDEDGNELGEWLMKERHRYASGRLPASRIAALNELGMIWDTEAVAWEEGLAAAQKFYADNGHLKVPVNHTYCGRDGIVCSLATFLQRQREYRRKGKLSADRVEALEAIAVDWSPGNTKWKSICGELQTFRAEHNHLAVPGNYVVNGIYLGQVIVRHRKSYADGTIPAEREKFLTSLGMIWDVDATRWEQMIDFLIGYRSRRGNILVPRGVRAFGVVNARGVVPVGGIDVGGWLALQRRRRSQGDLSDAEIADLDKLGMVWVADLGKTVRYVNQHTPRWNRMFGLAERFAAKHGHLDVPSQSASGPDVDPEVKSLYQWLNRQRELRALGTLADERIAALDGIGLDWDRQDKKSAKWQTKFDEVRRFHDVHGHFDMRHAHDGYGDAKELMSLYKWLVHQRRLHREGELADDRARKLVDIGFDMRNKMERAWDTGIAHLAEYRDAGGDVDGMKSGYQSPDGYPLADWLSRAKRMAARGQLSADQVHELTAHGVSCVPL